MMELPKIEIPVLSGDAPVLELEIPAHERARVLVVDDSPNKRAAIEAIIADMGIATVSVDSGRKALRELLASEFALILLDVIMPDLDGYETAQLIHSRPRSAHIPIIFVTAEAYEDEARLKGYTFGGVDWIQFPIMPEVLRAKIKALVNLYYLTRIARRQAEELELRAEEVARQNLLLEEASRVKSDFLASMSHELRTPLNAVIGFSEVLRDGLLGKLNAKQKSAIADILAAGEHLLALINDILDLSKVEAGKMTLELGAVDLAQILKSGITIVREMALKRQITLNFSPTDELGEVGADLRKMKQILFNLLSNAVKFTEVGGSVQLAVRRVARQAVKISPPKGTVAYLLPLPDSDFSEFIEIAVHDTGIGIEAQDLPRLFQTFTQIDSAASRRFEGTGLGLALVRRLTELHSGTVGVTSAPGKGSTFFAWLPWREPPATESSMAPAAMPVNHATPASAPAAIHPAAKLPAAEATATPLALIIEDDNQTAELLRLHLENEGLHTTRAANAEDGIVLAQDTPPALIVLDILLPGLSGWDALERIKKDPLLAAIPVVIVSVVADARRGFALGAAQVLQKPIGSAVLHPLLERLGLGRKGGKRGFTVLAVDDDPKALDLISAQLKGTGAKIQRALSGREALAAARRVLPDLILLDLMMPLIDGFQVVEALKARPETATIPIIIVTAKTVTTEDRQRLNGSIESIVAKSGFDREAFLAEVRRALGKKP